MNKIARVLAVALLWICGVFLLALIGASLPSPVGFHVGAIASFLFGLAVIGPLLVFWALDL